MIFWPLENIDYIINSFCNCDQFTEAIREVITYQTHDRQKGVILSMSHNRQSRKYLFVFLIRTTNLIGRFYLATIVS